MVSLSASTEDLDCEEIEGGLLTQRLGRALHVVDQCASTNNQVAAAARDGAAEGLVVVADQQSEGRGRQGRHWHSPAGENIYLSLLLRPACPPVALPPLTLAAGVALARGLAARGLSPRLKWPNDLLLPTPLGMRKGAGILTEMSTEGARVRHVVLGLGLNVHGTAFPPELADRATSLRQVSARSWRRSDLISAFLNAFEGIYDDLLAAGPHRVIAEWRQFGHLGVPCRVQQEGQVVEGIAEDLEEDGALRIRQADGTTQRVFSGEIV